MAKSSVGRGKKSSGNSGNKSASKRSRSKDQHKARLRTIRFNSRRIRKVIRRKLQLAA